MQLAHAAPPPVVVVVVAAPPPPAVVVDGRPPWPVVAVVPLEPPLPVVLVLPVPPPVPAAEAEGRGFVVPPVVCSNRLAFYMEGPHITVGQFLSLFIDDPGRISGDEFA